MCVCVLLSFPLSLSLSLPLSLLGGQLVRLVGYIIIVGKFHWCAEVGRVKRSKACACELVVVVVVVVVLG